MVFWSLAVNAAKKKKYDFLPCFATPRLRMFPRFWPFPSQRKAAAGGGRGAAGHGRSGVRAFSEKENSSFRATPQFLWVVRAMGECFVACAPAPAARPPPPRSPPRGVEEPEVADGALCAQPGKTAGESSS